MFSYRYLKQQNICCACLLLTPMSFRQDQISFILVEWKPTSTIVYRDDCRVAQLLSWLFNTSLIPLKFELLCCQTQVKCKRSFQGISLFACGGPMCVPDSESLYYGLGSSPSKGAAQNDEPLLLYFFLWALLRKWTGANPPCSYLLKFSFSTPILFYGYRWLCLFRTPLFFYVNLNLSKSWKRWPKNSIDEFNLAISLWIMA